MYTHYCKLSQQYYCNKEKVDQQNKTVFGVKTPQLPVHGLLETTSFSVIFHILPICNILPRQSSGECPKHA